MGKLLGVVLRGVKRAVTKEGGALATITNEIGKRDTAFYIAFSVRLIIPVVVLLLLGVISKLTGLEIPLLTQYLVEVTEALGL